MGVSGVGGGREGDIKKQAKEERKAEDTMERGKKGKDRSAP